MMWSTSGGIPKVDSWYCIVIPFVAGSPLRGILESGSDISLIHCLEYVFRLFHLAPAPLPPHCWGGSCPYLAAPSRDVKGEWKLMLSNYAVPMHVFREDDINTAKWSAPGRDTGQAMIQLTDIRHLPVGGDSGSSKRQTQRVFSRPLVRSYRSQP